jgi:hypothetical protein
VSRPQPDAERYVVAPWITHERLDDEVMAIDLETGAYFALDDVAADAWTALAVAGSVTDAVAAICASYDVDDTVARGDLERFAARLVEERLLLVEAPDSDTVDDPMPPGAGSAAVGTGARRTYAPPDVHKYDDMEELLRLDPVHDVDEIGWPVPRRD